MDFNRQLSSPRLQKAYLLALCLQASSVLAETPEGEAIPEKTLVDQIMQAVKNPSAEHLNIYIGMGLVLAIIAGIVYSALGKEQAVQKISMDDLGPAATEADDSSKKAKSSKKKSSKKKTDGDWEEVDGLDVDELYKDMDQQGPWNRTSAGTLERADMIRLKKVIGKHTYVAYRDRKEEVMQERLEHFRAKRMGPYSQCIVKAAQEFQKLMIETTRVAAEYIDLDESNFQASMQDALSDPAAVEEMKRNDENVRLDVEDVKPLTREKAIAIAKDKIDYEQETEQRMAKIPKPTTPQEQQKIQGLIMIERTQIMDRIFVKHGVRMADMLAAEKEFKLDQDPELIALKNANKARREQQQQEAQKDAIKDIKASITPEQQAEIDELIAEKGPVDATPSADGKLEEDEFWKAFEIMVSLQIRYAHRITHRTAEERRALLKAGQKQQYAEAMQQMLQSTHKSKGQVHIAVLSSLNIEPALYEKSTGSIKESEERQKRAKATMQRIEIDERSKLMGSSYEPLTREVALERIKQVETKKGEFVAGIMIMAQVGQFPKDQIGLGQELAKYQAIDAVHEENGIEEGDIIIAFNKYQLGESAEFKAIIEEQQKIVPQRVQAGMQQIIKAQQERMRQEAEAKAAQQPEGSTRPRVFPGGSTGPQGEQAEDLGW